MVQLPHSYRGLLEGLGLADRADVLDLYAARAARGFGDGFAAIILPAYLLEIGFNPFQIGLVATSALLGSAATAGRDAAQRPCHDDAVERAIGERQALGALAHEFDIPRRGTRVFSRHGEELGRRIGEHGVELIRRISEKKGGAPVNLLTHCNAGWLAFVDYGSATAPIYAAHDSGIPLHVWVDETRPRNQGAKLTAWELGEHGVPHTVIADNAGGHSHSRDMSLQIANNDCARAHYRPLAHTPAGYHAAADAHHEHH